MNSLNADVLIVGKIYEFKSIIEALQFAKPHDSIYVYGGEFYGNIFLEKPVVLIGVGSVIKQSHLLASYIYQL